MESSAKLVEEVVQEIMRIHRSLPERPGIEEVEAAKILIRNAEKEDQAKFDAISRRMNQSDVPEELSKILREMQRNSVIFQSQEQKREAVRLLDLENAYCLFDDMIQRASKCLHPTSASNNFYSGSVSTSSSKSSSLTLTNLASVSGGTSNSLTTTTTTNTSTSSFLHEKEPTKASSELVIKDDSYIKNSKTMFLVDGTGVRLGFNDDSRLQILDSTLKPTSTTGQDGDTLSLIKLASLIEVSFKKWTRDLNLQGKLMKQIEWLPDSIGKLSSLTTLNLSENRIVNLPTTIGALSALIKLDLHSNRINDLPESFGDLLSLVCLDLRANQLTSLPATFGRLIHLEDLDLSSNVLSVLPEAIGSLLSLRKLDIETNNIEELPHTIGKCASLRELRADYNRLKALPEAVGRISSLEILSVRYNNIKNLPTTMASSSSLRELDISFNQLEAVLESLCFATTLVKINVSNNFADLKFLPRSIGNLEMLEELDISNNQIRFLPDSFRMLKRLCVLRMEGNPLEAPPSDIAEKGAQAVVHYMAELVEKRDIKSQPIKQKKSWAHLCFFSGSNNRKRNSLER